MKPSYNIGYHELLASLLDARRKRLLVVLCSLVVAGVSALLFLIYNHSIVLILMMFMACVISMLPLRLFKWCGFFDMNIILTVYATMQYGVPAGLFVGSASLLGIVYSGEVDNNLLYDLFASYLVVLIAALAAPGLFVPTVIIAAIIYAVAALIYHNFMGTLDVLNVSWTVTSLAWSVFFVLKLMPLASPLLGFA